MAAYVVVTMATKSPEHLQRYAVLAPKTLAPFGGQVLIKARPDALHGEPDHDSMLLIAFPDAQQANDWYRSADYQALIPLRNEGMASRFLLLA
ncbi:DUF1330 domain-containing protein [Chitinimonas sp.]|uniref:DUF1330 domain-containing protein n=1 Tax=Chitinimonas sp. TaxID=1934313 RepID=UPI0035B0A90C